MLGLLYQPVVFYRIRIGQSPRWWLAGGGPLVCAVLAIVSHGIFVNKVAGPVFEALIAVGVSPAFGISLQYMGVLSAAFIYLLVWLMASTFLIAVGVLWHDSGNLPRLLELNGLAFYSQVPWLLVLIVLALLFTPPALGTARDIPTAADLERLGRLLQQDAFLVAVRAANECFVVWLYALFGVGYHAVTGLSLAASVCLTLSVFVAFHLLRYAL